MKKKKKQKKSLAKLNKAKHNIRLLARKMLEAGRTTAKTKLFNLQNARDMKLK